MMDWVTPPRRVRLTGAEARTHLLRLNAPWTACCPRPCAAPAWPLGLWLDTRDVPLDVLAAWCGDPDSPWQSAVRHGVAMPASHLLMAVAAWLVPHGPGLRPSARTAHAAGDAGRAWPPSPCSAPALARATRA